MFFCFDFFLIITIYFFEFDFKTEFFIYVSCFYLFFTIVLNIKINEKWVCKPTCKILLLLTLDEVMQAKRFLTFFNLSQKKILAN